MIKEKYIYERMNPSGEKVYIIRKTFNNKIFNYGTYHNLEKAIQKRNELINNNWNRPSFKYYYIQNNSDHYTIRKSTVSIGTVHTLKEAREIIEYLITYNWDTNKLPSKYKKLLKENRNYRGIKKDSKNYHKNKNGGYDITKNNKFIYHTKTKEAAEIYEEYLKKHNWKKPLPKHYHYNKTLKRYIITKRINGKIKYYGSYKTLPETKQHIEELLINKEITL